MPILRLIFVALMITALPCSSFAGGAVRFMPADLESLCAGLLMVGFRGTGVEPGSPVMRDVAELGVGGVMLFDYDVVLEQRGRNITGPEQLRALTGSLRRLSPDLLIGVDQEGGRVQRLKPRDGFIGTPSAEALGIAGPKACREAGRTAGRQLRAVGIDINGAPVADAAVNPEGPVIGALGRTFSTIPEEVGPLAAAFAEGLREEGVLACIKHFPGHGSAGDDSHLGLTDVTETWKTRELAPFRYLIEGGHADLVMTAHIFNAAMDPEHPASLSRPTVTGLLRDSLGWQGVVISDDLNMRAISDYYGLRETLRLAVLSGVDILLFGNNLTYDPDIAPKAVKILADMVRSGDIPLSRVRESLRRIEGLRAKLKARR